MYQKFLVLVDKNSQEVNRKTKWNLPKISGLQGGFVVKTWVQTFEALGIQGNIVETFLLAILPKHG